MKKKTEKIDWKTGVYKEHSVMNPFKLFRHLKRFKQRFYIIMHRKNGTIDLLYVYVQGDKFVYEGGVYIIHKDFMRWSDKVNTFVGHYFEGFALPINMDIDIDELRYKTAETLKETRISANVDANILASTVKSEVIQKLMRGEELEKFMNTIKTFLLFTLVAVVATLLLLLWRFFG